MAYAWLTDIHLEFLRDEEAVGFIDGLAAQQLDGLLLTGDISIASRLEYHLRLLERCRRPVYFVLGNHDYYGGAIATLRKAVEDLCRRSDWLRWLPAAGVIALSRDTCLVGHDGWADGRFGDYAGSKVILNDYLKIHDFLQVGPGGRLDLLNSLGDDAAVHFRTVLPEALAAFRHVLVLTHVPPFRQACWHEGNISADDWLPHFSCRAVGEALREAMRLRPDRQMTVLCGHTHSSGQTRILPNLLVKTGGADYGLPVVQEIIG